MKKEYRNMPRKGKFQVGDVVSEKAIIIDTRYLPKETHEPHGYWYTAYSLDENEYERFRIKEGYASDFRICDDKCKKCNLHTNCLQLKRIVPCNSSEFGIYRQKWNSGNAIPVNKSCDNCESRFICLTHKFMPDSKS